MGSIVEGLTDVAAADKHRDALAAMEREIGRLRAENADLRDELAQYIQQWETLDNDAVRSLEYLSQSERGHAHEIAQACRINIQCVESQLRFLSTWEYVAAPANGAQPGFALTHKGRRYLRDRGLLKAATGDRCRKA